MSSLPEPAESGTSPAPGTRTITRRGFLITAAAGAGVLAAPGYAFGAVAGPGAAAGGRQAGLAGPPPRRAWQTLRHALSTGHLVRPGMPGYDKAKELFDPRFDYRMPAGIAYCAIPADVIACLTFVRRYQLPVRVRSGGHSYAGWSTVTGGLVVDVTQMNSFRVRRDGLVQVGTGIGLLEFYQNLARHGLAVPGGSCPTVGIAGLALGGGIGVLARQLGLTCDALRHVQIVTADGSVLECNQNHYPALFWACRGGGGGNFGVATSFRFSPHPLRSLSRFHLSWPWSQAARVVDAWQSWAPTSRSDKIWSNMFLGAAPGSSPTLISVSGTYTGSLAGLHGLLGDLYARVGSGPSSASLSEDSYLNVMLIEAGCAGLDVPQCLAGPGAERVPQYAKSDFFTRKLNAAGIRALLDGINRLSRIHGAAGGSAGILLDALGGAVNRVKPDATAFVHRDALFSAQYLTSWTPPGSAAGRARQHRWLRDYYAELHPHASGQAYQNYIDPDLTDWQRAYYGANYPRLQRVKSRYDPNNLFTFPQAITKG